MLYFRPYSFLLSPYLPKWPNISFLSPSLLTPDIYKTIATIP
jgi:hypothetical protein